MWFIKAAGCDVVYTDYIRIVAEYLPDVTDPDKFFVPDILTRIPATFLQRLINVEFFSYSVTFDRICSAAGITGCALMTAIYMKKERLSALWFIPMAMVIFSLNKWEIILNGTAWAHVAAFSLFFLNYYLLDRYYQHETCQDIHGRAGQDMAKQRAKLDAGVTFEKLGKTGKKGRSLRLSLYILPFVILMFAGEYIASYAAIMIAAYGFCLLAVYKARKMAQKTACKGNFPEWNVYAGGLAVTLIVLGLYLLSRHFAVWEHAGATDMDIFEVMAEDPLFIPRLFIKSFAGVILGQQAIADFYGPAVPLSEFWILLIGMLVIAAYIFAILLYIRHRLWRISIYPMMLLLSGGLNHVLVTAARWIFLNEDYGLSSRYGAQFMIGIIGILLTFALYFKVCKSKDSDKVPKEKDSEKACKGKDIGGSLSRLLAAVFSALILSGSILTTKAELGIVPYREQNYEELRQVVLHYHDYDAQELADYLEWGKSKETMYEALRILEENRLNVFSSGLGGAAGALAQEKIP